MATDLQIGTRLPAFCTAMGRVMLANLPSEELESYLQHVKLYSVTPYTITNVGKLRSALELVRRNGYAVVNQELRMGLRTVAVPVRSHSSKVVAGLNLSSQKEGVPLRILVSKFLPVIRESAREIGMLIP
jgi:IclR family pca regulon transcriptional regulator